MKIRSWIKAKLIGIDFNALGVAGVELDFLMSHVPSNSLVMEIGCGYGQTTRRFAEKGNKVYAIDPFLPHKDSKLLMGENPDKIKEKFFNHLCDEILQEKVIFYNKTSENALKHYDGTKLDFIFIDGEHSYKALEIDIKWLEHLKEGGLVAFHDCTLPEVNDFLVKHVFPKYEFIGSRESTFIFRKGGRRK